MYRLFLLLLAGSLSALAAAPSATAQNHAQTARAFVQSPRALGMGDAAVAFGANETAFFYNPAKLAHIGMIKPKINLIGARTSISTNVFDQMAFYRNEVSPRIEEGLETLTEEELRAFYDRALEEAGTWAAANGDVLLPSVMMRVAMVGVGGGLFSQTHMRYRLADGGGAVPSLQMTFQSDQIAVVSGAVTPPGLMGVSVGLSARYTYRLYGGQNELLPDFDREVVVPLLSGSSLGFDLGLLYEVPALPGDLRLGLAVYDLVATDLNYRFVRNLIGTDVDADGQAPFLAAAADHQPRPALRLGAAYLLPTAWIPFLGETGVALDYMGHSRPLIEDPSFWTRLHLGAQTRLAMLALRVGVSQGHPTWGTGLNLGFLRLDYAFYAQEYGRYPGDQAARSHTIQLSLGL